ncbi:MAG: hypothetical protein FJZ13_04575 [Candidatus Omnitrophica bacterium]|nr:hypothetical protein [Candidatus Omnitrophota bacterium]
MVKKRLIGIWVIAVIFILLSLDFLVFFNSFPYVVGFLLPFSELPKALDRIITTLIIGIQVPLFGSIIISW